MNIGPESDEATRFGKDAARKDSHVNNNTTTNTTGIDSDLPELNNLLAAANSNPHLFFLLPQEFQTRQRGTFSAFLIELELHLRDGQRFRGRLCEFFDTCPDCDRKLEE